MPKELTFQQAFPYVKATLATGKTPALLGKPGIGKSSFVEDLAKEFKTEVFTLPVNQLADRADLTGVRMIKNEKTGQYRQEAFPHSTIMDSIEYAKDYPDEYPILFLDEFNRATQDITSAILSFQTLRRVGTIDLPDNLRLIVAGNDEGNVTSLDGASISRFTLYKVIPDVETFMSVQKLNPYVQQVLTQFPDDLMANKVVLAKETDDDDDDQNQDDDAKQEASMLEMFGELSDGGAFEQITSPRTISYLSEWLDNFGLDKSGSDAERELLGGLFSDLSDDESSALFAVIEGHVGTTTFSYHLFDAIRQQFNSMLTATHTASQPILMNLRPAQSVINQLSRAQDTAAIEQLVSAMGEKDVKNAFVWLMETDSTKEINNNQAVEAFIPAALESITEIDSASLQNLMKVFTNSNKVSKLSLNALMSSQAASIATYKPVLNSLIDQN